MRGCLAFLLARQMASAQDVQLQGCVASQRLRSGYLGFWGQGQTSAAGAEHVVAGVGDGFSSNLIFQVLR